jgi:hypothetical protein
MRVSKTTDGTGKISEKVEILFPFSPNLEATTDRGIVPKYLKNKKLTRVTEQGRPLQGKVEKIFPPELFSPSCHAAGRADKIRQSS